MNSTLSIQRILNGPFNETLTQYSHQGKINPYALTNLIKTMQEDSTPKENIILALAWLSLYPIEFKQVVHSVLTTPTDWITFINLCRKGQIRNGLGRCIRREMIRALNRFNTYIDSAGIHAQLIQIARPHPSDTTRKKWKLP